MGKPQRSSGNFLVGTHVSLSKVRPSEMALLAPRGVWVVSFNPLVLNIMSGWKSFGFHFLEFTAKYRFFGLMVAPPRVVDAHFRSVLTKLGSLNLPLVTSPSAEPLVGSGDWCLADDIMEPFVDPSMSVLSLLSLYLVLPKTVWAYGLSLSASSSCA